MELLRLYEALNEQYHEQGQLSISIEQYESSFWNVIRQLQYHFHQVYGGIIPA